MTTRKQKAAELQRLLSNGPSLALNIFAPEGNNGARVTKAANDAIEASVRRWIDTWVTPLALELVPELKAQKPAPVIASAIAQGVREAAPGYDATCVFCRSGEEPGHDH